jgi:TonB family protein
MRTLTQWVMEYALNAAWQVPVIFATAWFVAGVGRRAGAGFVHRVWVSALLTQVVLPACSVSPAAVMRTVADWFSSGQEAHGARVTVVVGSGRVASGLSMASGFLVVLTVVYGCCLLYFILRLATGLMKTSLLRRRAELVVLERDSSSEYQRYKRLFGVTDARVGVSAEVAGPVTIGVKRPMLLLPADMDLSARREDVGAVFAHEFAHMSRHDFAKNLLYELLSLPIAFHPLLWMTRTRLSESREMVCDAMAAEAVAGRQDYARSLLRLASDFSKRTRTANFHAIGIFDANHFSNFERRIMNLTEKRIELRGMRRVAMATAAVVIGFGACASALALRVHVSAPMSSRQENKALVAHEIPAQAAQTQAVSAAQSSPMPEAFVMGVPHSDTGAPAQVMKVEVTPITEVSTVAGSPAPMRIRVLTPAKDEPSEMESQANDHVARVSGGVMAGNVVSKVNPVYPQEAKDAKVQGTVVLDAVIGKDGNIRSLQIVSGPEELTKSAWEAVKQWTYKPYLLNGNPTEVETTITVNYSLAQ